MSRRILNPLAIFIEAFQSIDISEEYLIQATSSLAFIHLFDDVEDFRMDKKTKSKLSNLLLLILLVIIKEKACSCFHIASVIRVEKTTYLKLGLIENNQCPSHDPATTNRIQHSSPFKVDTYSLYTCVYHTRNTLCYG